jgi:hypothetical protein
MEKKLLESYLHLSMYFSEVCTLDVAIEAKEVSEPLKACTRTCTLRFSTCSVCVTPPRVGSRDVSKTSFPGLRNTIQQRAVELALPHSGNKLEFVSLLKANT